MDKLSEFSNLLTRMQVAISDDSDCLDLEQMQRKCQLVKKDLADLVECKDEVFDKFRRNQSFKKIGVMASSMGHQFANLLTALDANILLSREELSSDSQAHKFINNASQLVDKLVFMVNSFMDFVRNDNVKVKATTINVSDYLNDFLVSPYQLFLQEESGQIVVELDMCEQDVFITVDVLSLDNIFTNLFSNAYDAMKGVNGKIKISTKIVNIEKPIDSGDRTIAPGDYCSIIFSDTGGGINASDVSRIFKPFYTTKFDGTGLGMMIISNAVKANGGSLDVKSSSEEGTAFEVLLPVAVAGNIESMGDSNRVVLIITNDRSVQMKLINYVSSYDFSILLPSKLNPDSVRKIINENSPDLIIYECESLPKNAESIIAESKSVLIIEDGESCSGSYFKICDNCEVIKKDNLERDLQSRFERSIFLR